jgi:hypothetical protein
VEKGLEEENSEYRGNSTEKGIQISTMKNNILRANRGSNEQK